MEIIVGKNAGFCYGVERAVSGAQRILENEHEKVYCLGELVHNKDVVKELEEHGLMVVDTIEAVNQKVMIRAHGISKEVYEYAKEHQIELFDFTCPNVLKIHEIVKEYVNQGFFIILFGSHSHPETIATKSFCGKYHEVIEKKEEIETALEEYQKSNIKKLLMVAQTTYSLEKFEQYTQIIQEKILQTDSLRIINTICPATKIRQEETKELSKKVDMMIIIGGKNSSNTQKLLQIATENGCKTIGIENASSFHPKEVEKAKTVGIMAGASTPQKAIEEVIQRLQEYNQEKNDNQ